MMTDIEIAQATAMKPIYEIASEAGIDGDLLEPYGKYKAKLDARAIRSAIKQAMAFIDAGVIESIEKNVQYMRITGNEGE